MNFIIDYDEINMNNIKLKKNLKILYNYKNIYLLGLPLKINIERYIICNNYIKIFLKSDTINILKKIDEYFGNFKFYKPLLTDNYIYLYNFKNNINNEFYINIHSLNKKDLMLYLNIYQL